MATEYEELEEDVLDDEYEFVDDEEEDVEEEDDGEEWDGDLEDEEEEEVSEEDIELPIDGHRVKYSELVSAYRQTKGGADASDEFKEVAKYFKEDDLVQFVVCARKQGFTKEEIASALAKTLATKAAEEIEELEDEDISQMDAIEKKIYLKAQRAEQEAEELRRKLNERENFERSIQERKQIAEHNDNYFYEAMEELSVNVDVDDKARKRIYQATAQVLAENEHLQNKRLTKAQAKTIITLAFGGKNMASKKEGKQGIDAATRRKLLQKAGRQVPGTGARATKGRTSSKRPEELNPSERRALLNNL